jgi:hypothetical protein
VGIFVIVTQDHLVLFEPVDGISRVVEGFKGVGEQALPGVGRGRRIDGDLLFQAVGFWNVIAGIGSLRSHPAPSLLMGTDA